MTTNSLTTNKLLPYGLTLIRVIVGIVFLAHGSQKLFAYGIGGVAAGMGQLGLPLPLVSATLVTATEFLGGLALILGLGTRLAAAPIAFAMLIAVTVAHGAGGFFLPTGFEYALTLLVLNVALILTGPGAFALDNVIGAASALRTPDVSGAGVRPQHRIA
jgi:putative oxidoreductase